MKKISILLLIFIIQIILIGCTTERVESTFPSDMIEAGFSITNGINLGDGNYEDQLLYYNNQFSSINVTFNNIYTFEDESSVDYGYIYDIEDEDKLATFFENRKEYSTMENDIIFIYMLDNYVLEVYQTTNSTFPGFLRNYEFEANYQYYMFYTSDLVYPPIISALLENGATLESSYTDRELIEPNGLTYLNIHIRQAYEIRDGNVKSTIIVIEVNSIDDAILVYENQADLFFPASAYSYMFVQYQNLVLKITYPHYTQSEVLNAIMGDVAYEMYDEVDVINS